VNPAVPGHTELAAAPGPAVEEEPRTPAVGAPRGGGVITAVAPAVIITVAALVVRSMMLADQMWCTEDDTIAGGVTRCLPATDTMKTVANWVILGLLGLIWVCAAVAVLHTVRARNRENGDKS
jgi:hypothetical protein